MTTTGHAAELREAFKSRGWTPRQIGIRSEYYAGGSSITVTIKDGQIPFHEVEEAAASHESIRRCEYSGEILSGGNRYVSVNMTAEARALKGRRYIEAVERAAEALAGMSDGHLAEIVSGYHLGRGTSGWGFSLWGDSHIVSRTDLSEIALSLALEVEKAPTVSA